jgi:multiple antibiotic resistance protein
MNWLHYISLFTLGFTSLFPLINPVGTALILNPQLAVMNREERQLSVRAICINCLLLGLGTLFAGSWCLKFMGISIPTTQLAGGLVIARMGLKMLSADDEADRNTIQPDKIKNSLFFPMSFPLTIGPGSLSVLITLSAHVHSNDLADTGLGVLAAALLAVLVVTYFCFLYSDRVIARIGSGGSLVLDRLMSFLVFCIGLQLALSGLAHTFPKIFEQ